VTKLLDFDITAEKYKDVVNAVLPVNNECRINFNKNGIEIKQVDGINVQMVMINLPKKCFKSYNIIEPTQVGFDFYVMDDMKLTSVSNHPNTYHKPDDIYSFEICKSTGLHPDQPLYIADIDHGIFMETMQLLDPGSVRKEPKIPELNADAFCKVDKRLLNQTLSRNTEYVWLKINEDSKTCTIGYESDILKCNAPIPCDTISGEGACMYNRALLQKMIASCKVPEIPIKMSTNYPMTVSFPICEFGICTYLLAPRIEDD